MERILMGGCYKTENGWLIVGINKGGYYQCRDIEIDDDCYDEDIRDMTDEEIRKIADLTICYRAYYGKERGLYAVWDESKPHSEKIFLQRSH